MKKILKLFLVLFAAIILNIAVSNQTFAYSNQMGWNLVAGVLSRIQGSWYAGDSLVAVIDANYINDCEVLTGFDFAGGPNSGSGYFRIKEAAGIRDLKLKWDTGKISGRAFLMINDGKTLYRR